ncbi:MAG: 50S ribosomal protein L17 [Candidatus Nealsonbacteria bacterium RBG_13_36_15]|uniref:Large ribosomal subunit protein bL17 n=1 Tax=Candidatus Nealsonbacteria bacterium RBG_13_36_15 TaxID=1801660 RepID=A0A1G2DUY4_9BACT|nr:MAG: 50S ribosomal protein L17 [Candidatus Nealsonbacteria bacterium RBG_13_36_15]
MRKRKRGRKFSRKRDQRKALLKGLGRELLLKEKIKTTEAKAKELRGIVERFITKAKRGDLHSRRLLLKSLSSQVVKKLIKDIAPRYKERKGGYTRILKLGLRESDKARMAIIELVK